MIFDVATIVYDLSQYVVLDSGDLILTGSPEGSLVGPFPYVAVGDVVEVDVEGLRPFPPAHDLTPSLPGKD